MYECCDSAASDQTASVSESGVRFVVVSPTTRSEGILVGSETSRVTTHPRAQTTIYHTASSWTSHVRSNIGRVEFRIVPCRISESNNGRDRAVDVFNGVNSTSIRVVRYIAGDEVGKRA